MTELVHEILWNIRGNKTVDDGNTRPNTWPGKKKASGSASQIWDVIVIKDNVRKNIHL